MKRDTMHGLPSYTGTLPRTARHELCMQHPRTQESRYLQHRQHSLIVLNEVGLLLGNVAYISRVFCKIANTFGMFTRDWTTSCLSHAAWHFAGYHLLSKQQLQALPCLGEQDLSSKHAPIITSASNIFKLCQCGRFCSLCLCRAADLVPSAASPASLVANRAAHLGKGSDSAAGTADDVVAAGAAAGVAAGGAAGVAAGGAAAAAAADPAAVGTPCGLEAPAVVAAETADAASRSLHAHSSSNTPPPGSILPCPSTARSRPRHADARSSAGVQEDASARNGWGKWGLRLRLPGRILLQSRQYGLRAGCGVRGAAGQHSRPGTRGLQQQDGRGWVMGGRETLPTPASVMPGRVCQTSPIRASSDAAAATMVNEVALVENRHPHTSCDAGEGGSVACHSGTRTC
eukprot:106586-Pelagomonas_calceolata.AAC.4